jgi:tetratricopeptide (TPR) repeat protein
LVSANLLTAVPHNLDSLQTIPDFGNDSLNAEAYISLAFDHTSDDPEMALKYAVEAEKLAYAISEPALIGKSKSRKGVAYYYMNQMELSTENYFEALNIFDSLGMQYEKARSLNNIGWNLRLNDQYTDAIAYFEQGLEITKEIKHLDLMQALYNNLGTAYRHAGEKQKALDTYYESLKINQQEGNQKWEAYNLNNIGLIYLDIKEYKKSEEAFVLASKLNVKIGQQNEYAKNLLNLSQVSIEKGDLASASSFLEQADLIIQEHDLTREKLIFYYYKTNLLKAAGNYQEAFNHLENYVNLEKELNKFSVNNQIALLRRKYELAQDARELEAYKRKVGEQRFVIFGGVSLFLFLLAILLLVIKLYKSKNVWAKNIEKLSTEVSQKNDELEAMNEEMKGINENLEEIVKERTLRIQKQNEKLIKYAFINSHEIRGPLARVLGLLHLISLENKKFEHNPSFKLLDEAAKELDLEVKQASELLSDEDFFQENQ